MSTKTATKTFPKGIPCPDTSCTITGSLPGLRRHVVKAHSMDWRTTPALVPTSNDLANFVFGVTPQVGAGPQWTDDNTVDELRAAAKAAGVKGWSKMRKTELLTALV